MSLASKGGHIPYNRKLFSLHTKISVIFENVYLKCELARSLLQF